MTNTRNENTFSLVSGMGGTCHEFLKICLPENINQPDVKLVKQFEPVTLCECVLFQITNLNRISPLCSVFTLSEQRIPPAFVSC